MMQIESLGPVTTELVPGYRPLEVPQAWKDWIAQVAPLVPDIPRPTSSMIQERNGQYGPPPEWLDWLRAAAKRVPHITPPEEIPKKSRLLLYLGLGLLGVLILRRR